MSRAVLVTGGLGYIGSHAVVALCEAGYEPVIVDNLSNASRSALTRIESLGGRAVPYFEMDVRDTAGMELILREHRISAVMHFAGSKAVGESVQDPIAYYDNNVSGTISLVAAMKAVGINTLIFSSSATVYSESNSMPVDETGDLWASNPYGRSKRFVEEILTDLHASQPGWGIACLRYFNPVGAHASGLIGEDPRGTPNNLVPYIAQVAVGRRARLSVFGNDYETSDGTGVRDFVHVLDLVEGHLAALRYVENNSHLITVNLGTGKGTSVLGMLRQFELVSGQTVPYVVEGRRPGDVAKCWADVSKARDLLGWSATRSVAEMCADTWRWQQMNPKGYSQ
ncbi:UDP-glucose 4-epimerase GalE [Lysobacter rhizosphaerae]